MLEEKMKINIFFLQIWFVIEKRKSASKQQQQQKNITK
jgi:hypothetical protein